MTYVALKPAMQAQSTPPPAAPSYPHWTFANLNGDYYVDATTNLVANAWWTVAQVYGVTNLTIYSDTVPKRNQMFYRVRPSP